MQETLMEILNDAALREQGAWRRRVVAANALLFHEGERARQMYLVESGTLRVVGRVELEDHRHIQPGLADLGPGDLFGEFSLFEERPRSAGVMAVTESQLVEIDCESLTRYLDLNPEQGYRLLKALFGVLVDRMSRASRRVENLFAWGLKAHGIDRHL